MQWRQPAKSKNFYGYASESGGDDQEKAEKGIYATKQYMKVYEEDCLEAEVNFFIHIFFLHNFNVKSTQVWTNWF